MGELTCSNQSIDAVCEIRVMRENVSERGSARQPEREIDKLCSHHSHVVRIRIIEPTRFPSGSGVALLAASSLSRARLSFQENALRKCWTFISLRNLPHKYWTFTNERCLSGVELIVASSLSRAIDTADIIFPPGEVRRTRVCLCVRVSGCVGVSVCA